MGLLYRILGKQRLDNNPFVLFGRYNDAYREKQNGALWDKALLEFEQGNFIEALKLLLDYLKDEEQNNIHFSIQGQSLQFEIIQGSKIIKGEANEYKLRALAQIAKIKQGHAYTLKRLLERNFDLTYSKYALDEEDNLIIVFDTYTSDSSPFKLFYAFKELATQADKLDDLLLENSDGFLPVGNSAIRHLPTEEKAVKYAFLTQEVKKVFRSFEELEEVFTLYPSARTYLLLNLGYKIDYLIRPEGLTMEALERIHRLNFAQDGRPVEEKNNILLPEFQKLLEREKEAYFKEFYQVSFTFSITKPITHQQLKEIIRAELGRMNWYLNNGYDAIALAISGYIVGYCLFNFTLPLPDRELFHLYYQIMEFSYFKSLGFKIDSYHNPSNGKVNGKAIRKAVKTIKEACGHWDMNCDVVMEKLNFDSLPSFARSFLEMVLLVEIN